MAPGACVSGAFFIAAASSWIFLWTFSISSRDLAATALAFFSASIFAAAAFWAISFALASASSNCALALASAMALASASALAFASAFFSILAVAIFLVVFFLKDEIIILSLHKNLSKIIFF